MSHVNFQSTGYVDLQVNGYAGVDFNHDNITVDEIRHACQCMQADGTITCLATIITAAPDAMLHRIRQLVDAHERDELIRSVLVGIHIEGPTLNTAAGFRGAHPADALIPATPDRILPLLEAGRGLVKLFTLAPECDINLVTTRRLVREGCLVAAGHTNASLDQLKAAIDAGLSMVTHLGNGCPMMLDRHDNIIQRCLYLRDELIFCFIADGVHVPFFALSNYIALAGIERAIIVTDAMSAAGLGPGRYTLGDWTVEVGEDLAAWAPGRDHLLGSAMSMQYAAENLRNHLHLNEDDIHRLTHTNAFNLLNH